MIQTSPCFILLKAKFSKNCQPLSEASPWGAFLAELPPKGNCGGLLCAKRGDEGRSILRAAHF